MGAFRLFSPFSLALLAGISVGVAMGSAHARTVTLDKWMPTIRLCPVSCISVSGHKLRNGNKVQVLQVRNGWARISPWLDAEKLKRSFGERVPEKPAYWVELSRTDGAKVTKSTDKPIARTKRVAVRQQRRVTVPVGRPVPVAAGLEAAENSMIVNALATDARETARVTEAVVAKVESTANTDSRNGAPAIIGVPANPSERALTTDKMAEWIAANRGEVIEDVKESAAAAQRDVPVAKGEALETQIVALKTPDDATAESGEVPDVMTTELLDKRLNILPGMNSKIPEETVIALRHHALQLLDSGTCKGIAGGGAGEKANTIYLVCTDDLTRTREFPLGEAG